jgi:dihydroorotate dehydrogenase (NAD+) catalytic subunit
MEIAQGLTGAGAVASANPIDLAVRIGPLTLANPVMPASGCFGPELAPMLDLGSLGALVTKTVFAVRRAGNRADRVTETSHGMLNSVGIPSPGSDGFRRGLLRRYRSFGAPVIVSIGGLFVDEYWTVAEDLAGEDVAGYEVNVSCPNLEHGGLAIGTSPEMVARVVSGVVNRAPHPVIVKLTPTVTSIEEVALAAQEAGAAAVTVSNSFSGLAIDIHARSSVLGNGGGGLTGPAVKPLALRLVRDAAKAVTIPVIGCGGITTASDVAEFLIAGATAVQVGTATFTRPSAMAEILADLPELCRMLEVSRIAELTGTLDSPMPVRSE